MNRTVFARVLPSLLLGFVWAQEPPAPAETKAKAGVMDEVVRAMRSAEAKATQVRLEMTTEGAMPGDLKFSTKGTMRVLRTEQGVLQAAHVALDCTFAGGIQSRMESVKTPDGLWTFEQNQTLGEVWLHYDKELLQDLEWAADVLQRSDLPGGKDARAAAPLGSEIVADLAQRYDLRVMRSRERNGQDGTWYGGDRKPSPGQEDDADIPVADHVELFVRQQDTALLEVVYLQQQKPIQRIKVDQIVLGEAMPLSSFVLDTKGKKPKDVRDYPPEWEQIQQVLQSAKDKAAGKLPPSEQKKADARARDAKVDAKGDGK
jgi:hypothetical protein